MEWDTIKTMSVIGMTEKRYIRTIVGQIYDCKDDKWVTEDWDRLTLNEDDEVVKLLNAYDKENDELKQQLKTKCIVNKQYEENQRLIKMLDNVANYMQKEHREIPLDDFVEWWNNIATEGLDD